jgi:hypothetical protein
MARKEGDWGLAQEMAQAMYERAPDYGGSHYALATVALHNGDARAAAREFAAAEMFWQEADPDLVELVASRRALAEISKAESH